MKKFGFSLTKEQLQTALAALLTNNTAIFSVAPLTVDNQFSLIVDMPFDSKLVEAATKQKAIRLTPKPGIVRVRVFQGVADLTRCTPGIEVTIKDED